MKISYSGGSYEICYLDLGSVQEVIPTSAFLFTDKVVADHYPSLVSRFERKYVLESGEQSKCLETFGDCLNWLAKSGATRRSQVVALGGGVVGDLVGFVASAYMRGVKYFQVPTTLLAQVDSSVGGKVAIDLPEGKNLAGAFYPPTQVLICNEFLSTLPSRQIRNGLAEVLKYGFIYSPELLAPNSLEDLGQVVKTCIEIKAEVVEADEFETLGLRASLNFGHTVGHAIEKVLGYRRLLHGEAISIGMVVEAELGERLGLSPPGTVQSVVEVLGSVGLPLNDETLDDPESLVESMYRDKKAGENSLSFSLLSRLGECKLITDIDPADVKFALSHVKQTY